LLDLLGAFEDVEDLGGAGEGEPDRTSGSPFDQQLHAHPLPKLIDRSQRPTEQ
jgi:hypothetical protein